MSARVDQRGKNQQQQQNHQVNGNVRVEDYDYAPHPQMHGQPLPQQAQYNAGMQMSTPTDTYMNNYYHQSLAAYAPNFFDSNAWSTTSTEAFSYLGSYGQQMSTDYMQFPGFDYGPGFWPAYQHDYSWAAPQQDAMKVPDTQSYMPTMDQAYTDTYHSPTGVHQKSAATNGQEVNNSALTETDDVNELEQGIQKVAVNGHSESSQESVSDTSLHEPTVANVNNSSVRPSTTSPSGQQQGKVTSWANIAKQPAKPTPVAPKIVTRPQPTKSNSESSWDKGAPKGSSPVSAAHGHRANAWAAPRIYRNGSGAPNSSDRTANHRVAASANDAGESDPTLSKLKQANSYNPKQFDLAAKNARFFVIKSYSEDDIHRAIKYGVWCSTEHGNKRLDAAFKDRDGKGPIYLFYSVNGSGHFCGMAQMMSGVDYQTHAGVWTQDKWKGSMEIKWIYVKDVPNGQLRHIRLENNENKPVTNSRDTQEIPPEKGRQVLKIIHSYRHSTSIFDDFGHYEKKEVEEGGDSSDKKKSPKLANGSRN